MTQLFNSFQSVANLLRVVQQDYSLTDDLAAKYLGTPTLETPIDDKVDPDDLAIVKDVGRQGALRIRINPKNTEPGSLNYLLFGTQLSTQSINVRMGKVGEDIFKKVISLNKSLELLTCGPQIVATNGKRKDVDLLWRDDTKRVIYMREIKGNMNMDTEKIVATYKKIPKIFKPWLTESYPDYSIDLGILGWGGYDRGFFKKGLSQIKACEAKGVKVEHPKEFFELTGLQWEKEDYYDYFRELGEILNN